MKAALLILAAGFSKRFNYFPKALVKIKGKTFIELLLEKALQTGLQPIIVLGYKAEEVRKKIPKEIPFIINEEYKKGMFSSVLCGIKYLLEKKFIYTLIQPVDAPLISKESISDLKQKFDENIILIPEYKNKSGHPPLVPKKYFSQILQYDGNDGLRGFFRSNTPGSIQNVSLLDPYLLLNINSHEELKKIKDQL